MAFVLSILLLVAGVWSGAEAQEAYDKLSEPYRKGVDLALQQVNNLPAVRQTFLFFKTIEQSDLDVSFPENKNYSDNSLFYYTVVYHMIIVIFKSTCFNVSMLQCLFL